MEENRHQHLIEKSLKGDVLAQHRLFQLYVKAMYNTVLRIVPEVAEAEDVVQEGFIKAFSKLKQLRNESTFGAWLKRIMVNTALNSLQKYRPEFIDLENLPEVANEEEPDFEGPCEMARVHQEIKKLPQGCRVIFSLHQLEGYDQQEIADILSISLSTVKTQYRRARLLLKKRLMALQDER